LNALTTRLHLGATVPFGTLKAITATLTALAIISARELPAQARTAPSLDTLQRTVLRVKPSATNARIHAWDTTHVVYYDPKLTSNKLLLWLAGTNGTPLSIPVDLFNTAFAQGYRVIALSYMTVPAVSQLCIGKILEANANCAEMFRQRRVFGDNAFALIPDEPHDAIVPRLVSLLQWLSQHDPAGNWSRYLVADGSKPDWTRIAVSGQSQGGGMSEFIAQHEVVARMISFSGGWDYADSREKTIAGWYAKPSATPMDRWFATYNVKELAAAPLRAICTALRIPPAHVFALDQPLGSMQAAAAAAGANPYHGDGIRNIVYKPIWVTMLGSGTN
jgi:hypothetical protein